MAKCKGCGREIIWGKTEDGKSIPLDPKPPVYYPVAGQGDGMVVRRGGGFVSHFATCRCASDFSANKRREERHG